MNMLPSALSTKQGHSVMPTYHVHFDDRETLPDELEREAAQLGITVEMLIKRYICSGLDKPGEGNSPSKPASSLEEFLVLNGAVKPDSSSKS